MHAAMGGHAKLRQNGYFYEPWFAIKLGRLLRGVPYVPITCTTRVERGTTLVSMAQYKAETIVEMCTIGHITYY